MESTTPLDNPHIQWGNRYIFVQATMQADALKVAFPTRSAGWPITLMAPFVFVKKAAYEADAEYFDFGSSSQCYCREEFVELETLGPRPWLAPGQNVSHRERWQVYSGVDFEATEDTVAGLVRQLGL
ncbi:MAG: hypothetical protein R3264_19255 [Anaerolineae bacterium]|nr:hypothetical protein [Anaerolineae bacterium]